MAHDKLKWQRSRPGRNNTTVAASWPSLIYTPGRGGLPLKDHIYVSVSGQAQAYIHADSARQFAQAQADIKQQGRGYGQSLAKITGNRLSQLPVEIIVQPTTQTARLSQFPVESIVLPTTQQARLSQIVIEIIRPNITIGLGQAQAEIQSGVQTVCGQSQAWIKQTYSAVAQAQADIKAVGSGLGQSQADIKAVGYGLGQSNSDIKAVGFGLGQAQGDIKQTYYGLGQSQSDIKATSYAFGQAQGLIPGAPTQCGQSQAWIKTTNYGLGQAQGNIQNTYFGLGQAASWIKNTYYGLAQAQAYILGINYPSGQSQGTVKTTYYVHGQAQGYIPTPSLEGLGIGQAQAWIAVRIVYDIFDRFTTFGDPWGTPNVGPDWTTTVGTEYTFSAINGAEVILAGDNEYDWLDAVMPVNVYDAVVQMDVQFVDVLHNWASILQIGLREFPDDTFNGISTYVYYDPDEGQFNITLNGFAGNNFAAINTYIPTITPAPDVWYTLKLIAHGRDYRAKFWETSTQEPDWQLELLNTSLVLTSGMSETYADLGEAFTPTAVQIYDNFSISKLVEDTTNQKFGYAQAFIDQRTKWMSGQAEAYITTTKPSGQAAARIQLTAGNNTTNNYQEVILNYGPASYYPLNEALPDGQDGYAYDVIGSYDLFKEYGDLNRGPVGGYEGIPGTGTDTAIYSIGAAGDAGFNHLYRFAQPISIGGTNFWAIEFWLKPTSFDTNGGNTPLLLIGQQASNIAGAVYVNIDDTTHNLQINVINSIGGTAVIGTPALTVDNWIHVIITRANSNLWLYINGSLSYSNAGFSFGPLSDTVFISPSITSNNTEYVFDELALYNQNIPASIALQHFFAGLGHSITWGQARAHIRVTNNRPAQAQAFIRFQGGRGQAQAKIKAFNVNASGQALGTTTRPEKSAQAQARISVRYYYKGQAQAWIKTHHRPVANARASIKNFYQVYGQARAIIFDDTKVASGQVRAFIKKSAGYGQAQGLVVKAFRAGRGQAQATIVISPTYVEVFRDTFTRTTSLGVLGTPDVGTYAVTALQHISDSQANGVVLTTTTTDYYGWVRAFANISQTNAITSIDFRFLQEPYDPENFDEGVTLRLRTDAADQNPIAGVFVGQGNGNTIIFGTGIFSNSRIYEPLQPYIWYTLKLEALYNVIRAKIWKRDYESEPIDWFLSNTTTNQTAGSAGYLIDGGATYPQTFELDNFFVFAPGTLPNTGQAQAYISTSLHVHSANAQAFISNYRDGFGQAQAHIKVARINKSGLSRAVIIKGNRYKGYGQAQAFIGDKWNSSHGLARAWIVKPQPSGQAQARIFGAGTIATGLARAKILKAVATYSSGQAMGMLKMPAMGQAAALISGPRYLVRYNGYDLPGYAQLEDMESVALIQEHPVIYMNGSDDEYIGISNKTIKIRMAVIGTDYASVKDQVQLATTMVRSSRGFTKLYIQHYNKYYMALAKTITMSKAVTESMKRIDYEVEFEAKPWLYDEE